MIKNLKSQYISEPLIPAKKDEDDAHHRQGLLENWDQSKLKKAKVGIIGAGGLGGHTAISLSREGFGRIVISDFDVIELSNLNRQPYYKQQINKNKAIELGRNLTEECTEKTVIDSYALPFHEVIDKYQDAFFDADLLLCLVDNDTTRQDVAKYGLKYRIPILFSGVSENAKNGYVFIQKNDGGCFNCLWNMEKKEKKEERNICKLPSVIYIHQILSGVVSFASTGLIMDWKIPWTYLEIDLDGHMRSIDKITKKQDCKLCGD